MCWIVKKLTISFELIIDFEIGSLIMDILLLSSQFGNINEFVEEINCVGYRVSGDIKNGDDLLVGLELSVFIILEVWELELLLSLLHPTKMNVVDISSKNNIFFICKTSRRIFSYIIILE